MSVVGINPDQEIISALSEWLALAKQGRLTNLVASSLVDGTTNESIIIGALNPYEIIGVLKCLGDTISEEVRKAL